MLVSGERTGSALTGTSSFSCSSVACTCIEREGTKEKDSYFKASESHATTLHVQTEHARQDSLFSWHWMDSRVALPASVVLFLEPRQVFALAQTSRTRLYSTAEEHMLLGQM